MFYSDEEVNISLNRLYLLNKFGYECYSNTDISFKEMINTCSHEIAHYFQYLKHGRSSCESDLESGKYEEELAKEHEEWTREIYQLIEKDLSELENKWKAI